MPKSLQVARHPHSCENALSGAVAQNNHRHAHGYRRQRQRPGVLPHHFAGGAEHVARQFEIAAGGPVNLIRTAAHSLQILLLLRARGATVQAQPSDGMACAPLPPTSALPLKSASTDAFSLARASMCPLRVSTAGKSVSNKAKSGTARRPVRLKKMWLALQKRIPFCKVGRHRIEIVAPALEFDMIPLADVIDAHMQNASAGQPARYFLAEEEIGPRSQLFHRIDGIVIRNRHQIHAQALQSFV